MGIITEIKKNYRQILRLSLQLHYISLLLLKYDLKPDLKRSQLNKSAKEHYPCRSFHYGK